MIPDLLNQACCSCNKPPTLCMETQYIAFLAPISDFLLVIPAISVTCCSPCTDSCRAASTSSLLPKDTVASTPDCRLPISSATPRFPLPALCKSVNYIVYIYIIYYIIDLIQLYSIRSFNRTKSCLTFLTALILDCIFHILYLFIVRG